MDKDEFVVKVSQLSPFLGMIGSDSCIDFELTPPIDSVLLVRAMPDFLSPSSELLSVVEPVPVAVVFLST